MHERTLVWSLVGLLALSGAARADDAATASTTTPDSFAIWAEHDGVLAKPGTTATFLLHAQSKADDQTVAFTVDALPDWLTAGFAPSALAVPAGGVANASLTLAISPDATAAANASEPAPILVHATNAAGESHSLRVYLKIGAPRQDPQPPTPTPSSEPGFLMRAEPDAAIVKAGGYASFMLHVKAKRDITLDLSLARQSGDGYALSFATTHVALAAGNESRVPIVVQANASPARYGAFDVQARDDGGATRDVTIKVGLAPAPGTSASGRFVLGATPQTQKIAPGGEARFTIGAKSTVAQTLKLGIGGAPRVPGYEVRLASGTLDVAPDAPATTTLVVMATDAAAAASARFEVYAIGEDGERHAVSVRVETDAPPPPAIASVSPPAKLVVGTNGSSALPNGIEIGIDGFDASGGLRLTLKLGDSKAIEVRIAGATIARLLQAPGNDAPTAHHSPLWIRLEFGE